MTDHPNHPAGQRFTARWGLDWDDYRRAIALQAHYTNKFHIGIDALLIDAAEHGRVHQLIVAMLDLNETLMPAMGEPEIAAKLSNMAAYLAAKYEMKDDDDRTN